MLTAVLALNGSHCEVLQKSSGLAFSPTSPAMSALLAPYPGTGQRVGRVTMNTWNLGLFTVLT